MANTEKRPAMRTTEAKFSLTEKGKELVAKGTAYETAMRDVNSIVSKTEKMLGIKGLLEMWADGKGKEK